MTTTTTILAQRLNGTDLTITRTETRKGPLFTVSHGDESDIHPNLAEAVQDYAATVYELLQGHTSDREPEFLESSAELFRPDRVALTVIQSA